jgi:hypothetical protein
VFPAYSHRFSPQKFTQPQLFASLVLKEFLRLDYRKLAALLVDAADLAATIGLAKVPHFTTFQKAADRLLRAPHAKELLDATVNQAQWRRRLAATIDPSTARALKRGKPAITTCGVAPKAEKPGRRRPTRDSPKPSW